MPVLINDFEVLPDPPANGGNGSSAGGSPDGSEQPASLRTRDIERMIEHLKARQARLLAD